MNHWKRLLRYNFTNWKKLADFLELDEKQAEEILQKPKFVLNLPLRLAKKIQKKTLDDPILKQFLPTTKETVISDHFALDPVGDCDSQRKSKLLHKYQGRILLLTTGACAMHCRYCFRQNFDYETEDKIFLKELEYIENDPSIKEVILSGGDPLSLSDVVLEPLLLKISEISHVKRIRFHTRFPIGIPERIDNAFLELLGRIPQQIWFLIHCNHPKELDVDIFDALKKLQRKGIVVANQTVLLKGINDQVEILQTLCEQLVDHGILPYYLHQLDRVQGAAHFEVPEEEGLKLIQSLEKLLPGYAVPKYVREIAGEPSKTSLKN